MKSKVRPLIAGALTLMAALGTAVGLTTSSIATHSTSNNADSNSVDNNSVNVGCAQGDGTTYP